MPPSEQGEKRKQQELSPENGEDLPKKKTSRTECSEEGCTNLAANGGICRRHGGKRIDQICSHEGCTNKVQRTAYSNAMKGGVCWRHGAKEGAKLCSHDGCVNLAKKGGVCVSHGATWNKKICSHDGCTIFAQKGGVCRRHGAKPNICSFEGCTNQVQKGGVCWSHGARLTKNTICSREGCINKAQKSGLCRRHGLEAPVMTAPSVPMPVMAVPGDNGMMCLPRISETEMLDFGGGIPGNMIAPGNAGPHLPYGVAAMGVGAAAAAFPPPTMGMSPYDFGIPPTPTAAAGLPPLQVNGKTQPTTSAAENSDKRSETTKPSPPDTNDQTQPNNNTADTGGGTSKPSPPNPNKGSNRPTTSEAEMLLEFRTLVKKV